MEPFGVDADDSQHPRRIGRRRFGGHRQPFHQGDRAARIDARIIVGQPRARVDERRGQAIRAGGARGGVGEAGEFPHLRGGDGERGRAGETDEGIDGVAPHVHAESRALCRDVVERRRFLGAAGEALERGDRRVVRPQPIGRDRPK